MENDYIYCLEFISDELLHHKSQILPALEVLAKDFGVTNVYQTCNSIETFEESISTLLYEDKNFQDYSVLYLVFSGSGNQINIDNFYYSFEEIAEFFQGKLKGKIVHFANTFYLDLEEETFQYFLDVTGAKALSGYKNRIPVLSMGLDNLFFSILQETDNVVEMVELLYEKNHLLSTSLGFRLYY